MGRDCRVFGIVHGRKCEVDSGEPTKLTVLANRTMVPAGSVADARLGQTGRRPASGARPPRPMASTAPTASNGSPDEARPLARAARVATGTPGSARRPRRSRRSRATSRPRPSAARARASFARMSLTPPTRRPARQPRRGAGPGRRPVRRRPAIGLPRRPSARTRIASSGSSVVRISGRPRPADMRGSPARVEPGTPSTIACSTDETCSIRSRTGRVGAVPARHAIRDVGAPSRPTRAATTTSPASRAASSIAIASRPSRTSNGDPLAAVVEDRSSSPSRSSCEAGPPEDERAVGVVLEVGPRHRSGRGSGRSAAARRPWPAPRRWSRRASTPAAARPGSAGRTSAGARPPGDERDEAAR